MSQVRFNVSHHFINGVGEEADPVTVSDFGEELSLFGAWSSSWFFDFDCPESSDGVAGDEVTDSFLSVGERDVSAGFFLEDSDASMFEDDESFVFEVVADSFLDVSFINLCHSLIF